MIKEKNLQKLFEKLQTAMQEKLTPKERDVLRLHLGFDDGRQRPSEEVCQLFCITKAEFEKTINSVKQKTNEENIKNIMQIFAYKNLINNIFSKYIEIPNDKTEELIDKLDECLNTLEEDKREIFKYYFGITTGENEDFASTAEKMGIEEDAVERAVASVFRKLRHPKTIINLKNFEIESEKIMEEKWAKSDSDMTDILDNFKI